MEILKGYRREDITKLLPGNDNTGIELGVAEGIFARRLVSTNKFKMLFGVDMYQDPPHDVHEFKKALNHIGITSNYKLLRMKFTEAYDLFEDNFFDFVYVDGYAGKGEDGGTTIFNWLRKVKVGGVLAGDDYDKKQWPLVTEAVDTLCQQGNFNLMITDVTEKNSSYSKYPTWAIKKTHEYFGSSPADLVRRSELVDQWGRTK